MKPIFDTTPLIDTFFRDFDTSIGQPAFGGRIGRSFHSYKQYPPYNIVQVSESEYAIELAIAGFARDDITVDLLKQTLQIRGSKSEQSSGNYIHKGISNRSFELKFRLADNVDVSKVVYDNGILSVSLTKTIPEEEKPRTIQIEST